MDPEVALLEMRAIAAKIRSGQVAWGAAEDLADRFYALDEWLSNGGFYPRQWQEGRGA